MHPASPRHGQRQRQADDEFWQEGRGIKTETELTRFMVFQPQQHYQVREMVSQSMNSVSGAWLNDENCQSHSRATSPIFV